MCRNFSLFFLLLFACFLKARCQNRTSGDTALALLPDEGWWGGIVTEGQHMPFGGNDFSFNFYNDNAGNQTAPFLVSNKGRYIWSEQPYRFSFQNDSLLIEETNAKIIFGNSGTTLKQAYTDAARNYFPSSGKWPDSLLITSPQYNLWIELLYNPTQKDVLTYANAVLKNNWPAGVLMIDDNWTNYYGQFDFDKVKFPDPKAMLTQLHQMGFKVMVWICPYVTPDSPVFRELAAEKM